MAYFQILGTGPSTPITEGTGRNVRRRSSAVFQNIATYILIDATHDLEEQIERALSVTAVVLSNPTRDAAGGLGKLDRWLDRDIPLVAPPRLYELLEQRYGPFDHLHHQPMEPLVPTVVGDVTVTALPLTTSGGSNALPNYGYRFDTGKKRVAYASDVKIIPPESEPFLHDNDLLVIDGGGWARDLPTHRGALNHLHVYAGWGNQQLLFTNIGRSAPPHTQASAAVRSVSPRADVAFDFMKIPLGR